MERTDRVIDAFLDRIPSLSVTVWVDGEERYHRTAGLARLPDRPARDDEPYDLASLTKVLATVPVAASLVAAGRLDLDAPVREVLPDVDARITARHLLSHGSGYPKWAPLYERTGDWGTPEARRRILDAARLTPLVAAPGEVHAYSDLGFLVLCELIEVLGGARLDRLLAPLLASVDEADLRWGWPGAAATEDCPVRKRIIEGEVHDLNAFAMGGVSSHAGLFGTSRAVARWADALHQAWTGAASPLPGAALARLVAGRGPGSHRLGFDGITPGASSTGARFPADAVGHLGYTGTSVWIAPDRGLVVVVLTNRIHPRDDLAAIREARPRLHDAVLDDLG